MKVGIDAISFYTSPYYLDLKELAKVRNVDYDKYAIGIGQEKMAVAAPNEDVVTLAAHAAERLRTQVDFSQIDFLIFATETGIDQSKAAGIYVHHLLGLSSHCRVLECKQACYSTTGALQLALSRLKEFPDSKILLVASDIARYPLESPAEPTQGCGAVAMILSTNPRVMSIDRESGYFTQDVMDFWRPNHMREALVDGHQSTKIYLTLLEKTWDQYSEASGRNFLDHDHYCFHLPFSRMADKAHVRLAKSCGVLEPSGGHIEKTKVYARDMGNAYTASLYISLLSLLNLTQKDLQGKRVGFYSYGSGSVAEFFSGVIEKGYRDASFAQEHETMLKKREAISYETYEMYRGFDPYNEEMTAPTDSYFQFVGIEKEKRLYRKEHN